jgi:hypothetical protein
MVAALATRCTGAGARSDFGGVHEIVGAFDVVCLMVFIANSFHREHAGAALAGPGAIVFEIKDNGAFALLERPAKQVLAEDATAAALPAERLQIRESRLCAVCRLRRQTLRRRCGDEGIGLDGERSADLLDSLLHRHHYSARHLAPTTSPEPLCSR